MSLSGGLAANGRSALLAQKIWAEDVNAKGGILGRPVQLVSYDDQSNPANVPSLYTKLIDVDKVDVVTSPYATAMIAPSMPVVMQRGMCYVSLFGAGVNEKLKYNRYFSMNVTGDDIKGTYARGFLECTKMLPTPPKTISILAVDNDFAQRAAESVRLLSKEYGLRVVYDRSYPPSTVDFTPTIRAIQAQRPDVVFFASYPPDSNGILRAVSELRFTARAVRRRHDRAADRRRAGAARPHPEQPGDLGRLFARAHHAASPAWSSSRRSTAPARRRNRPTCSATTCSPMPMRRCRWWNRR